ncbi:hypothetical protein RO3G_02601 [Rhizopus delemar RA 99-880]|uniref:Uncharacterized protein n=1 Tax=Rhizopus delemar (strain RA 99-880 / ATCC MYA-4621 / FGSC 9543 / NRRL 43880) TaxID=246409 RepID=I1BNW7_RHIO9|nr:hypothetical protein RO3G_02601 [Rhizopus delemar RA 99-880]|eukprot:EIE77897.1 hypothetical protein RO3G_02601 [Rhizopus delemar RA 99-880]
MRLCETWVSLIARLLNDDNISSHRFITLMVKPGLKSATDIFDKSIINRVIHS